VLLTDGRQRDAAVRILSGVAVGEVQVGDNERELTAAVDGGVPQLRTVLSALDEQGIDVVDVGLRRPTLDDVFLSLTGRAAESAPDDEASTDEGTEVPA
jgi:ABC-2 type transport system ATP-binding protein